MQLFFDLDGTIIDVSERHYSTYTEGIKLLGGKPLSKAVYWHQKRAGAAWPELLVRSGLNPSKTKKFLTAFIQRIETASMLKLDVVIDGAAETLRQLKHQGHQLYLVTLRRNDVNLRQELTDLSLLTLFEKVIPGHADTESHNLKASIIDKNRNNEAAIVIGDTEADIKAAQSLDLESVAVLSGIRNRQFLESLQPTAIVETIAQLPDVLAED